jgi:uncharacterized phage-associated protein
MSFTFDSTKTIQAAMYLLDLEPGKQMDMLRLMKLMYMADRESIREKRRPISGDEYFSMEHGPVLSAFYNLIKKHIVGSEWANRVNREGNRLTLREGALETGRLSKYERRKLREVSEQCRGKGTWTVRDLTHDFPEWTDPGKSSLSIPLPRVVRVVGLGDEVDNVVAEQISAQLFSQLLAEHE